MSTTRTTRLAFPSSLTIMLLSVMSLNYRIDLDPEVNIQPHTRILCCMVGYITPAQAMSTY